MTEALDPNALIAAAAGGDKQAFAALMRWALPRAYRVALRLTGSAAEAEELAQEAMLRVWRHAGVFDPKRARFEAWLGRIVTNLALDRLRARQRAGKAVALDEAAELADARENAEGGLLKAARHKEVAAALAALPERQRAAIVLVHYEDLSGAEAAAALGTTAKAVEGLLSRAMVSLRAALPRGGAKEEQR